MPMHTGFPWRRRSRLWNRGIICIRSYSGRGRRRAWPRVGDSAVEQHKAVCRATASSLRCREKLHSSAARFAYARFRMECGWPATPFCKRNPKLISDRVSASRRNTGRNARGLQERPPLSRLENACKKAVVGVRQIENHEVRSLLHAGNDPHGFAEISLRLAGRMSQGHKHLPAADPGLANVIFYDGVAARVSVLGTQTLEYALGCLTLLPRPLLAATNTPSSRLSSIPRPPKHPGYRPPPLAIHKNRPPHPRVDLRGVHTSGCGPQELHKPVK
jgi:hypothetical protein